MEESQQIESSFEETNPREEKEAEEAQEKEEDAELKPVASTMVDEIAYEDGTLEVLFLNGKTETYPMSDEQWATLKNTDSVGKFMWENVLR